MLDCDTSGGHTKNVPKWGDCPRAHQKQNDDEPEMKTTMVFDRGPGIVFVVVTAKLRWFDPMIQNIIIPQAGLAQEEHSF